MTRGGSSSSGSEEGEEGEALEFEAEVTDHERVRLETIKQNEAVFASLNLKGLAASLDSSAVAPPSASRKKKNISVAVPDGGSGGRRRSQRLSSVKTSKVMEWSSDSSEASGAESDGPMSGGKAKHKAKKATKKKKSISLAKLDDMEDKRRGDVEYEPSANSESADSEDDSDEEGSASEAKEGVTRKRALSRKPTTPVKRLRSQTLKSPVKRTISLNSPKLFQKSPPPLQLPVGLDLEGEEDLALQQALALSMGSSVDMLSPSSSRVTRAKLSAENPPDQISTAKRRNKRGTFLYEESEIDAFFISIVGNKDGRLSRRHLEKAASTHDFIWKDEEINDMIDLFDADGDGQVQVRLFKPESPFLLNGLAGRRSSMTLLGQ